MFCALGFSVSPMPRVARLLMACFAVVVLGVVVLLVSMTAGIVLIAIGGTAVVLLPPIVTVRNAERVRREHPVPMTGAARSTRNWYRVILRLDELPSARERRDRERERGTFER